MHLILAAGSFLTLAAWLHILAFHPAKVRSVPGLGTYLYVSASGTALSWALNPVLTPAAYSRLFNVVTWGMFLSQILVLVGLYRCLRVRRDWWSKPLAGVGCLLAFLAAAIRPLRLAEFSWLALANAGAVFALGAAIGAVSIYRMRDLDRLRRTLLAGMTLLAGLELGRHGTAYLLGFKPDQIPLHATIAAVHATVWTVVALQFQFAESAEPQRRTIRDLKLSAVIARRLREASERQ